MEAKPRLLKRPTTGKTISKPTVESKPVESKPTKDTGVGGSSVDHMVGSCVSELMAAATSFQ